MLSNFYPLPGSPAIDAGITLQDVKHDKAGIRRPQGKAYDIGAYEYIAKICPNGKIAKPCLCSGLIYARGYCCDGRWQEYSCNWSELDAAKDGPIYGDPAGLARVAKLEELLHNMKVREDHPRIFITKETLPIYQQRVKNGHPAWQEVKKLADKGDMVNAAFALSLIHI